MAPSALGITPDRMGHLSYDYYRRMPYDERCRQIGALLAKAAIRLLQEEDSKKRMALAAAETCQRTAMDPTTLVSDEIEKQIVGLIARVGSATPRQIRLALDLNRKMVTRKLARLRSAGIVVASGKTNANTYQLRGAGQEN